MSESDQELQARIVALAGRINRQKQHDAPTYHSNSRDAIGWTPQLGTPYGVPRGSGVRFAPTTHRNRALVLNSSSVQGQIHDVSLRGGDASPLPMSSWVVKRDRHNVQLINPAVYDQLSQQRVRDLAESEEKKRQLRAMKEKARLQKHFQHTDDTSSANAYRAPPQIQVEGVQFHVVSGGSKLVRLPNQNQSTPKQAKIAGVTFLRSKNGNLYRAGLVKEKKPTIPKSTEPCPRFTATGFCSWGPSCRHVHDPNKVAICKEYLQKGTCPAGDACDLSHDSTPNRVPACQYFLRGNCTAPGCRYAHVKVNPAALVCRPFATLGYCEKGADCFDRHVLECPDYTNSGICKSERCRLPHVDRAGQLRKNAATAKDTSPADSIEELDVSSDGEEYESDENDVDSDGLDEDAVMSGVSGHADHTLSQQQDYVHLA